MTRRNSIHRFCTVMASLTPATVSSVGAPISVSQSTWHCSTMLEVFFNSCSSLSPQQGERHSIHIHSFGICSKWFAGFETHRQILDTVCCAEFCRCSSNSEPERMSLARQISRLTGSYGISMLRNRLVTSIRCASSRTYAAGDSTHSAIGRLSFDVSFHKRGKLYYSLPKENSPV